MNDVSRRTVRPSSVTIRTRSDGKRRSTPKAAKNIASHLLWKRRGGSSAWVPAEGGNKLREPLFVEGAALKLLLVSAEPRVQADRRVVDERVTADLGDV